MKPFDTLWLICLYAWTRTHWRVFVWLGTRASPHVVYFPDRPYTRIVSSLMALGLTQAQIKAVWAVNGTFAAMDNEVREETDNDK
jgi:hypothetical protein